MRTLFAAVSMTSQSTQKGSAKPKEGQEPFINMHLKQSRSFEDRDKCLFMYIHIFLQLNRGRIARDAWVFGILFTQFTPA